MKELERMLHNATQLKELFNLILFFKYHFKKKNSKKVPLYSIYVSVCLTSVALTTTMFEVHRIFQIVASPRWQSRSNTVSNTSEISVSNTVSNSSEHH
jgi:hypothetical protein